MYATRIHVQIKNHFFFFFVVSPYSSYFSRLEEEWEKELEAELHDYEVVGESKFTKMENWEREIEDMLEEGEDLK